MSGVRDKIVAGLLRAAPSGLALAAAALGAMIMLRLAGYDPFASLGVMIDGAAGGAYQASETLLKACPLILVGLGVALAFRGGLFNIGAEGQLLIGALACVWLGNLIGRDAGGVTRPALLAVAFVAGGAWASVAAWLKSRRQVSEVISTLMLNFIAFWLVSYLVHGPLQEATKGYPQTERLSESLWLPRLFERNRLHVGIAVAGAAAAACYAGIFFTAAGLRLRAAGGSPAAARVAGISLDGMTYGTLFLSGGLAGLAGGVEALGVTRRLYEQFSPGYGFMAIAVALLAQLHPLGVIPAAIFLAGLETGAGALQRASGVSSGLAGVIEALVIFAVIAARAPAVRGLLQKGRRPSDGV
jgi:simple sugar transport system permease protein